MAVHAKSCRRYTPHRNALRSRLLILCMVFSAGCQHSVVDTQSHRSRAATQASRLSAEVFFDPGNDFGEEVTVEGVLEGQWIYGPSRTGATFGSTMKGDQPLRIRYK